MTVICAVTHAFGVALAADSRSTSGLGKDDNVQKLFVDGEAVIGLAGATGAWATFIRRWQTTLPDFCGLVLAAPAGGGRSEWVEYLDALTGAAKKWAAHHHLQMGPPGATRCDVNMLIATPAGCFLVDDGLWWREIKGHFAVGTGAHYAMGAMWAHGIHQLDMCDRGAAERFARSGVQAAIAHEETCGGLPQCVYVEFREEEP